MTNKQLPKVGLRGGFSDRMGIQVINTEVQTNDLDERTRVCLINMIYVAYKEVFGEGSNSDEKAEFFSDILSNVYLQQINYWNCCFDEVDVFEGYINKTICKDTYDAVLTVVEYVVQQLEHYYKIKRIDIEELFNHLFKKEYVGYRFINRKIVPITDRTEVFEINEALKVPYENVNKHLDKALALISDRDAPDYENSIKESISAVEAMCLNILEKPGTLNDALRKIEKEKHVSIHPALRDAFIKLYGYAGDSGSGIRHASKLGGVDSTFQEARYMLVACSAFINYLKANMSEPVRKNDK